MKGNLSKGLGFLLARPNLFSQKTRMNRTKKTHETKRKMRGNEKYLFTLQNSQETISQERKLTVSQPGLFSDELLTKQFKKPRANFRTAQERMTWSFSINCIYNTNKMEWTEIWNLDALCPIFMRQMASHHIFRCVLASLQEGPSVGPYVRRSVRPERVFF